MKHMKYAALPSSMMFLGIIGLFISAVFFMKRWPSFGFSFVIIFAVMIIASILSITHASTDELLKIDEFERTHKGVNVKESKTMKKIDRFFGVNKSSKKKKKTSKKK